MQISNPVRVASIVSESYCPDCITYSHKKCTEIHLDPLTCRDGSCVRAVEESPSHARATIRIKALCKGEAISRISCWWSCYFCRVHFLFKLELLTAHRFHA